MSRAEIRWAMWLRRLNKARWLVTVLLLVAPAAAQLEVGENWKFNLDGDIGYNYNGAINNGESSHSQGYYGDANFKGSFYSPNFLSFSISPYAGRDQSNSLYGALSNSRGVNANLNLFSGSHFPGSVYFGKGYNSSSEFGLPASTIGLASSGNTQNFGVSWSEIVPGLPSLTASYTIGDGTNRVYGTQGDDRQNTKTLSLLSTYTIDGFRLAGGFIHRNVRTNTVEFLDGTTLPIESDNRSNNYEVSATHPLPLSGSFGAAFSHSSYGYDYLDSYRTSSSGAANNLDSNVSFRPVNKLTISTNASYTDSLLGGIPEPIQNGVVEVASMGKFRSFLVSTTAFYQVLPSLAVNGQVSHAVQNFLGKTYSSTQYGGGANYNVNHKFLGSFMFSFTAFDFANQRGNQGMGYTGNMNFNRKIRDWETDANFGYSQNVQTLIVVYTTSSYNWVTNVRRRLANRTYISGGYGGAHSGFTQQAGASSSSERVSGTLTWHTFNLAGFYSKADGTAVLTATGLTAVPTSLPPAVFGPDAVMTYNSKAVGANLGGVFMHRLTFNLGYADGTGMTADPVTTIRTSARLYSATMQFRMRKIYWNAGYTRLRQGVGTPGTLPVTVTSYYTGFTRWFNFF